ncbi:MAG TPA: hypothetical protein VLF20_01080 [Patescibacteria group bacterium]|nr:hypothetical protein [Patescibacteria group bacterium]
MAHIEAQAAYAAYIARIENGSSNTRTFIEKTMVPLVRGIIRDYPHPQFQDAGIQPRTLPDGTQLEVTASEFTRPIEYYAGRIEGSETIYCLTARYMQTKDLFSSVILAKQRLVRTGKTTRRVFIGNPNGKNHEKTQLDLYQEPFPPVVLLAFPELTAPPKRSFLPKSWRRRTR